ncbi:hypothetical protein [Streptomyces sp. BPTC-684]|uniref:hypothetical protein n=1 Tax=Streptomyces sp. BPTC-684 TaxID=3043734 RepID=UPI0024B0E4AC|nr:hypothetical protein [Streptomyces sp. BPTC-684]WHM37024.1 hypothetical protein QIY60_09035 [Streptomyces sp. BPTC-684]
MRRLLTRLRRSLIRLGYRAEDAVLDGGLLLAIAYTNAITATVLLGWLGQP